MATEKSTTTSQKPAEAPKQIKIQLPTDMVQVKNSTPKKDVR
jgi:hypothetical protein